MKLNFLFDNTSITRFVYNNKLNTYETENDFVNYYFTNLKYLEKFSMNYDNVKNSDSVLDSLNNKNGSLYTAKYSEPIIDSINNKGGSLYMSATSDSRVISFLNTTVPRNTDKFIIRFSPLFIFNPINIVTDLETNLSKPYDYMILTLSIYVSNLLFIEIGFNTNGNIYINNDSNRDLMDIRNKIDLSETDLKTLKTRFLYKEFYIILDKNLADIRLYDPYYYLYDYENGIIMTKDNEDYQDCLKRNKNYIKKNKITTGLKYIPINIDFLPVYKKCLYNNSLQIDSEQLVNIVITSKYIDNLSTNYYINKFKLNNTRSFKELYFKEYSNIKFDKRKSYLNAIRLSLQQKLTDIIATKLNSIFINYSETLFTSNDTTNRKNFKKLCEKCRDVILTTVIPNIETYFNNDIDIVEKSIKEALINKILTVDDIYSETLLELVTFKDDVTTLLRSLYLNISIQLEDQTVLKEDLPLTEFNETVLQKYRKMLIVYIHNEIFKIVSNIQKNVDFTIENNILDIIKKEFGLHEILLTETDIDNMDIKESATGETTGTIYSFSRKTDLEIESINYINITTNTLFKYIKNVITNELLNIYPVIIKDLNKTEKENISKRMNEEISEEYSILPESYEYYVCLENFDIQYLLPYKGNIDDNDAYDYSIDTIFNGKIEDRVKFRSIIDNYKLNDMNVMINYDKYIISHDKENTTI